MSTASVIAKGAVTQQEAVTQIQRKPEVGLDKFFLIQQDQIVQDLLRKSVDQELHCLVYRLRSLVVGIVELLSFVEPMRQR